MRADQGAFIPVNTLDRLQPVPKQGKVVGDRFFAAVRGQWCVDALCWDGDRSRRPSRAALLFRHRSG